MSAEGSFSLNSLFSCLFGAIRSARILAIVKAGKSTAAMPEMSCDDVC